MILWRALPWRAGARESEPGGTLWFPRELQGAGRHDNPGLYGCMYTAEDPVSAVAEMLAPFRGVGVLTATMLLRAGLPLALARLEIAGGGEPIDLDDPRVLVDAGLRPSEVATNRRGVTQAHAARLFAEHPDAIGLRWWSTLEASFANVTLFDRAAPALRLAHVEPLSVEHPATRAAAEMLGLEPGRM